MLNTWEEADAAADLFSMLDQIGIVYGENVVSGRYTTVLKQRLACRLVPLNTMSPQAVGARAELLAARDLYWLPSYFMPEQCQIEIDSIRWSPQAGTFQRLRAGDSGDLLCRCSVLRIQTSAF